MTDTSASLIDTHNKYCIGCIYYRYHDHSCLYTTNDESWANSTTIDSKHIAVCRIAGYKKLQHG